MVQDQTMEMTDNKKMIDRDGEEEPQDIGWGYFGSPFGTWVPRKPKELTPEEKQKQKQSEDLGRAMRRS